jgi:hypothetical protein
MNSRQRRILISALVGGALVTFPWLAFIRPILSPLDNVAFFLTWAGVVLLGISLVELVTHLWLRGRTNHFLALLALIIALLLLFIVSSYSSELGAISVWNPSWGLNKFLAFISGGYLLIVCWALFLNAMSSDPVTRSGDMLGGAIANLLICIVILIVLGSQWDLSDLELLIVIFAVIIASLAWSSALEANEAHVSSPRGIKSVRAIQAIVLSLIIPVLLLFWLISQMGFT